MPKNPKLSIIIPSFNQGRFLDQTLDSIFTQDYSSFEVLVLDGGSTDNSVAVIKKYAAKYPQLVYWRSVPDKGQVDALTQGFAQAQGDILAFINSDDYYLPGAFSRVVNHFLSHPHCRWVVGDCHVTAASLRWTFAIKHLLPLSRFPLLLLLFNWVNQPATFWQRSLFNQVGDLDPHLHYAFDYDLWLRFIKKSPPCRLHVPLSTFRIHQAAKGSSNYKKQFTEDFLVLRRFTKNPLILCLHRCFIWVTITTYRLLK